MKKKAKSKVHKVTRMSAQGDVLFRRVDKVPAGFVAEPPSDRIVVAHSETGHHHSIDAAGALRHVGENPLVCYLTLETVDQVDVVHHRDYDTHATLRLMGGIGAVYEVRRQREATPEGWRRVED